MVFSLVLELPILIFWYFCLNYLTCYRHLVTYSFKTFIYLLYWYFLSLILCWHSLFIRYCYSNYFDFIKISDNNFFSCSCRIYSYLASSALIWFIELLSGCKDLKLYISYWRILFAEINSESVRLFYFYYFFANSNFFTVYFLRFSSSFTLIYVEFLKYSASASVNYLYMWARLWPDWIFRSKLFSYFICKYLANKILI